MGGTPGGGGTGRLQASGSAVRGASPSAAGIGMNASAPRAICRPGVSARQSSLVTAWVWHNGESSLSE